MGQKYQKYKLGYLRVTDKLSIVTKVSERFIIVFYLTYGSIQKSIAKYI